MARHANGARLGYTFSGCTQRFESGGLGRRAGRIAPLRDVADLVLGPPQLANHGLAAKPCSVAPFPAERIADVARSHDRGEGQS